MGEEINAGKARILSGTGYETENTVRIFLTDEQHVPLRSDHRAARKQAVSIVLRDCLLSCCMVHFTAQLTRSPGSYKDFYILKSFEKEIYREILVPRGFYSVKKLLLIVSSKLHLSLFQAVVPREAHFLNRKARQTRRQPLRTGMEQSVPWKPGSFRTDLLIFCIDGWAALR